MITGLLCTRCIFMAILPPILVCASGCSILDQKKSDAIKTLAIYKDKADTYVSSAAAADRQKYEAARLAVHGYLIQVDTEVDSIAPNPFATIDLSTVPDSVRTVVEPVLGSTEPRPAGAASDIADWIYKQAKEARAEGVKALKDRLQKLEWKSWQETHR